MHVFIRQANRKISLVQTTLLLEDLEPGQASELCEELSKRQRERAKERERERDEERYRDRHTELVLSTPLCCHCSFPAKFSG